MKATGIVRRIDELGRVVIPKEIRRTLRIRVGDPLEIYTDHDGEVILKKYSPIGELGEYAREIAESLTRVLGFTALVCDRDVIIATAGVPRKEYMDKQISSDVERLMSDRRAVQINQDVARPIPVLQEETESRQYTAQTIVPIISEGEPIGAIILLSMEMGDRMADTELKVCQTAASFIGKQMEQ